MISDLKSAADATFTDAWEQYESALELLHNGDARNACRVAWNATQTATRAAALAHGEYPQKANDISSWIRRVSRKMEGFEEMPSMFAGSAVFLYQQGYCDGYFEEKDIPRLIYGTSTYILQAERLASISRQVETSQ